MGIYLPNVDMPKDDKVVTIQICPDGSIWQQYRGTVPNAKAVPVPPHGDLIDRREAIIDANERAYDFWLSDDEVNATIQFLNEQPTIIPAEEGEEQREYEAQVEAAQYCEMYEPTYDPETGAL